MDSWHPVSLPNSSPPREERLAGSLEGFYSPLYHQILAIGPPYDLSSLGILQRPLLAPFAVHNIRWWWFRLKFYIFIGMQPIVEIGSSVTVLRPLRLQTLCIDIWVLTLAINFGKVRNSDAWCFIIQVWGHPLRCREHQPIRLFVSCFSPGLWQNMSDGKFLTK